MEENHNPNSHDHLINDTQPKSWSELPLDLLNSVFERLGLADFHRGKSVCSSWYYSALRPKNQIPWLILFPEQNNNNCCTLFNPEEKHKLYKTQDLGVEFGKSLYKAIYGSWLLMRDPSLNLYIMNVITHERIDLPSLESQLGTTKLVRILDGNNKFDISNHREKRKSVGINVRCPVFWIDERTKDYVVIWGFAGWCVVYAKKGDTSWKQIPETSDCIDLVYKEHKLHYLCYFHSFKVFDFSGEIPRETLHGGVILNGMERGLRRRKPSTAWRVAEKKLVVTVTGEILKVERMVKPMSQLWSFRVYKVYSTHEVFKKHEQVKSSGDEAILFDLGITVLANGLDGVIKRNSIYFNSKHERNPNDEIRLFNLETQEFEKLHKFDGWSFQLSTARWFLPSCN